MHYVQQTIKGTEGGDCLRACVASILELPIEAVPNFGGEPPFDQWMKRLIQWLNERRLGVGYSKIDDLHVALTGPCILGIRTKEHERLGRPPEWSHAVVGVCRWYLGDPTFDIVHDPLPEPSEPVEYRDVMWIVRNAV